MASEQSTTTDTAVIFSGTQLECQRLANVINTFQVIKPDFPTRATVIQPINKETSDRWQVIAASNGVPLLRPWLEGFAFGLQLAAKLEQASITPETMTEELAVAFRGGRLN